MTIGLLIAFALICLVVDLAARTVLERVRGSRRRKEREETLAESLRMDFSREAPSLRRVEVKEPAARILCVDDEEIILDSFRKILVLDGYSVDTVQTGQEALGLIQTHHYDFVFTDLRMPAMDGLDVVKSVKHMRPDIDVVIITGYATVETAVECMKFGAMDYVQKPFTEDELRAFVKKALIKRNDQIQKQLKPTIHITHQAGAAEVAAGEFSIPGGALISRAHSWASVAQNGEVKVGMDDFAKKLIGQVDGLEWPNVGMSVRAGQPLFAVRQGRRRVQFLAPVSGRVVKTNQALNGNWDELDVTPYHQHWFCVIDGEHLDSEIPQLKIGKSAVALFQEDIGRFTQFMKGLAPRDSENPADQAPLCIGAFERLTDEQWDRAAREFFTREN